MSIRYDKQLNKEIDRTVKNFNQKINRLEKELRELIPSKITKKELKQSSSSRKDLQRRLKEMQQFSERGAEDIIETQGGVRVTKYEINRLKRESKRLKQKISREINTLKIQKPKVFGKEQTSTFSEMGDTHYLNLVARRKALEKDLLKLGKEDFESYKELISKTSQTLENLSTKFKENYLNMLTDLGYYNNYDKNKLETIKERIKKLNTNNFIKLFNEEKSIKSITDYYPIVTGQIKNINPDDIKEDVVGLYDNLYNNLNEILKDYE